MDQVFCRLKQARLKVKPQKCRLFKRETEFLGHVICAEGVKVCPEKVAAVKNWPIPTCVTELRSFLGTASYYRRFVAGFATIAAPLHGLTCAKAKFEWSPDCQDAFDHLKETLCEAPVLAFPVPNANFVLDTDASEYGVGAVLSQLIPCGSNEKGEEQYEERVIGYASRSLNVHERRYCTTRKELLAVVWFVRHFRPYLYGRKFFVRTDHASLQWLYNFWEPEGQVARWLQILGEYDFQVFHREGKKHSNADGLSRQGRCKQCQHNGHITKAEPEYPCPEQIEEPTVKPLGRIITSVNAISITPEWTPNQLSVWQSADYDISPILTALRTGVIPSREETEGYSVATKRYLLEWERLRLVNDVVYRAWYNNKGEEVGVQLVTPSIIIPHVLQAAHDNVLAGHYSVKKTTEKVRKHFFWTGLLTDVRRYCTTCQLCQKRKPAPTRPHHPLQQPTITEPLQRVTVDIMGFERATAKGNRYILVIVDTLTKWAEAYAMPDEKAETVARLLVEEFVCRMGIPAQLHSDQGRQFEAAVFGEMCDLLGIKKTRTTALHPQSDGQTERLNRTILDLLAKVAVDDPQNWDTKLAYAMAAYRSTPHATTGETPNRMMLGREATTPLQLLVPQPPNSAHKTQWVENLHNKFQETYNRVQEHYQREQRYQKKYFDQRQKGYTFKEGDLVLFYEPRPKKGTPYKLNATRWRGPYEIRKRISVAVYVIGLPGATKTQVVSTARLVPYQDRPKALQPNDFLVTEVEKTCNKQHENNNFDKKEDKEENVETNEETTKKEDQTTEESKVEQNTGRPKRRVKAPDRYGLCITGEEFDD
jgi:transposase InsO family protein